jgi:hypothetical protein
MDANRKTFKGQLSGGRSPAHTHDLARNAYSRASPNTART